MILPQKFLHNFGSVARAPSYIKIVVLWTAQCNKSLFFSNSTYLAPFMVVPGVKKYNPAVPFLLMAPHIVWLGGVFMVAIVYFWLNLFPTGLRTCLCRTINCWKVDSWLNKTLPQSSAVQWRCFLANSSLFFILGVNFGFLQVYKIFIRILHLVIEKRRWH